MKIRGMRHMLYEMNVALGGAILWFFGTLSKIEAYLRYGRKICNLSYPKENR